MTARDEPTPLPLRTPESHILPASDGGPLRLDYYAAAPATTPNGPTSTNRAVLLAHGFRGYKDWGFLTLLANGLAEEGIGAATFNFASSGVTDAVGTFGEPERFRRGTYAGDLEDMARAANWMEARLRDEGAERVRLGVAGHSRGGVIAILHAARDPRVGAVVTMGAPARIGVWPDAYWESWRRNEPAEVYDFRTKETLRLGPDLFQDWSAHAASYDTAAAVARLTAPLLVVHGTRDVLVPLEEARTLASFGRSTAVELRVIEGAGHSFQAGDKIRRTPPPLLDAIEAVTAWMRRWLQPNEMRDYFLSAGGGV